MAKILLFKLIHTSLCCDSSGKTMARVLLAACAIGACLVQTATATDCNFAEGDYATWAEVSNCLNAVPFNATVRDLTLQVIESTGTTVCG